MAYKYNTLFAHNNKDREAILSISPVPADSEREHVHIFVIETKYPKDVPITGPEKECVTLKWGNRHTTSPSSPGYARYVTWCVNTNMSKHILGFGAALGSTFACDTRIGLCKKFDGRAVDMA